MIPFTVLLVSLILLGAAIALRRRHPRAGSGALSSSTVSSMAPSTAPADGGQDLLPEGSHGGDGLAAFYAYQMAAGSIERPR